MRKLLYSVVVLLGMTFCQIGCGNRAELIAYREAVHQYMLPVLSEHEMNSKAIAGIEGFQLPDISMYSPEQKQNWLDGRLDAKNIYMQTYEESKQQDNSGFSLFGKPKAAKPLTPSNP